MILKLPFGRTNHKSTRTIFGAFALSTLSQKESDKILEMLFEYGINHIDTAPSYGNSELRIGPWMQSHRNDFFLATKTDQRTYKEAKDQLYQSLDRLKVDKIDLWQMHFLVNEQEWKIAMSEGGALEALIEAKEEGLVDYIGVTGHGLAAPRMHLKSLEKYDFDSVLFPYNYTLLQNPEYASDVQKLIEKCRQKNVAMQTIKSIARGQLGTKDAVHNVWYDPLTNEHAIKKAVNWVLGNEHVFLNTSGDVKLLAKILQIANQPFKAPTQIEMQQLQNEERIIPLFNSDEE